MSALPDLVERLRAREQRHREAIANSQIVVDLLAPQMRLFDTREGQHNLYAVRMAVDHKSSIRTTTKEADELAEAIARITQLETALEQIATVDHGGGFLGALACRQVANDALRAKAGQP